MIKRSIYDNCSENGYGGLKWALREADLSNLTRAYECICSLEDLENRVDFEEIKKFYGIGYAQSLINQIVNSK